MFLTITIDTKNESKKLNMTKRKLNPMASWKIKSNAKKRGLFKRIASWKRSLRRPKLAIEKQPSIF